MAPPVVMVVGELSIETLGNFSSSNFLSYWLIDGVP